VLVLVDSESSASFINEELALQLGFSQALSHPTKVQVTGGGILQSAGIIRQLQWSMGDCQFCLDFQILPLVNHDLIVGMDWLSAFSPMQIHWQEKWLAIPYQGAVSIL
jgi:hypothetical protein